MQIFRKSWVIVFLIWGSFLQSCPASAALELLSTLEGDWRGVAILKVVPPLESKLELEFIRKVCQFYVKEFAAAYRPLMHFSEEQAYTDAQMKEDIQKDCDSDFEKLPSPNSYFLVAQEQVTGKILGLAVFEVLSPGRVYLSSWLADSESGKRGLGKQLLKPIFTLYPEIRSLELVVASENFATVQIYERWGFIQDSQVQGPTYVQVKTFGMSLQGDAFSRWARSFVH